MTTRILRVLGFVVFLGVCAVAHPVCATREPVAEVNSGDHDIYQISHDVAATSPSVHPNLCAPPPQSDPVLQFDARNPHAESRFHLWLSWFRGFLTRR